MYQIRVTSTIQGGFSWGDVSTGAIAGGVVGGICGGLAGAGIVGPAKLAASDFWAGANVGGLAGKRATLSGIWGTITGAIAGIFGNPTPAEGADSETGVSEAESIDNDWGGPTAEDFADLHRAALFQDMMQTKNVGFIAGVVVFGTLELPPTALAAVAIAIGLACLPEDAKKSLLEGLESFWDSILSIGGKTNKPDPAIATKNKQNLKNTKNPEPPKQQDSKKNPPTDVKPTKEQQTKREGLLMGLARAFAEALHGFFGGP